MSHAKFNLFANSLFVVYIIFDGAVLSGEAFHLSGRNTSTREYLQETERDICDTCAKPDIFFLVFDEYESSNSLKKRFGYRNNLDSILLMKNFHIQWHSRSNYNLTPFSMASTLNMDYLEQIPDPQAITAGDYANCIPLMKHCRVLHILQTQGYKVFNRSIFNLWDQPAFMRQKFIPMGSAVIRSRTLISKLKRDIGWAFIDKWPYLRKPGDQFELDSENLKLVDSVMNLSHPSAMQPRFIYAHFMMPHKPFFRDQYGRKKDLAEIDEELHSIPASAYLNYLPFVNGQITKMVDAIMNNDPKAVIILLSDHGFRSEKYTGFPDFYFNNLSAIYYPDGKYGGVPDSLSNVNLFRVVFNKLFQQSYELLKDRPVFLQDAKVLNSWN